MAKYIPLDALVAKIERLKDNAHYGVSYHQSRQNVGLNNELATWEHLESAFVIVQGAVRKYLLSLYLLEHLLDSVGMLLFLYREDIVESVRRVLFKFIDAVLHRLHLLSQLSIEQL